MMKKILLILALFCSMTLAGCGDLPNTSQGEGAGGASNTEADQTQDNMKAIPFQDGQLYAVAWLGYDEVKDLEFYKENYLGDVSLPIHYVSKGDYYLIIPRDPDATLQLYVNDMETMGTSLIYEEEECRPFIVQCNVSDIFPDVTISLTGGDGTAEFSPYISLKDGSVQAGEYGLDLTKQ